ncbi:MAG TPA: hydantoinase B/oxoprolinase family protein [Solirubrobacteraceae bacterium]|jgi:N-methylhydantoinase B
MSVSARKVDPATIEVVRNALVALAQEMMINVKRAAYSPSIHEIQDVAVGLLDADGQLIACAPGLPMFLADLGECVRDGLELLGRDRMREGDVYLSNDPYTIGTHINNVATYLPIFRGGQIIAFAAVRGHMVDMGGAVPGSRSSRLTEIYQEGLRLRQVRYHDQGRPVDEIHRLIADNTRMPEAVLGDLRAQVAACRTGERRLLALLEKYGDATMFESVDRILRHGEELARAAVRSIPDGSYSADAFLDDDGIEPGVPIQLTIAVEVSGDEMTIDFSGYPDQVRGSINTGPSGAIAIARTAFKCLTTPTEPVNEGQFRPLTVKAREGTVVSAQRPAACGWWARTTSTSIDMVFRSLAAALPDRVPAGHFGDVPMCLINGVDRAGRRFVIFDPIPGGHGGRPYEDGPSATVCFHEGDTPDIPVEVQELMFPILVQESTLDEDSGGAGRYRGGLGYRRVFRMLGDANQVQLNIDRNGCLPWGLGGGLPGAPNRAYLREGAEAAWQLALKRDGVSATPETEIMVCGGGGGGWGDPLEREPEAVLADVVDERISPACAERDYGVVIAGSAIDLAGTEELRARRREAAENAKPAPQESQ